MGIFNISSSELESARDILLKARHADPMSLEGMGLIARIHFQLGEIAELRNLVNEAAAACNKRPESTLFLAMLSILEGSPAKHTLSLISDVRAQRPLFIRSTITYIQKCNLNTLL